MPWTDVIPLIIMGSLGIVVCKTDIERGMVYNKHLLIFFLISVFVDAVYYGRFHHDMFIPFLINVAVVMITSLLLFYSHCFAGGDCKLIIVYALLYPANCYLNYYGSLITIVFTIGVAAFYGYLYLLGSSIYKILRKKNRLSLEYVKNYFLHFFRSFITAIIWISLVTLIVKILGNHGIGLSVWAVRIICIATSWFTGKYPVLRKRCSLAIVLTLDVILSSYLGVMPISIHPENYLLVIALLICQMMIRTNLYEEITIDELSKGMILSAGSSMLFQKSRVRGLPGMSTESLKDRLTEEEVDSIKRWNKHRKIQSITVVKKIPFALFVTLGYFSYFCMYAILLWL